MISDCIERILDQEDVLKLHFSLVSSAEHCYAAGLLSEMYSDTSNSLYMHFLWTVLMEIKTVNKYFQLETGDTLGVFRNLDRLYMSTLRRVVKPSVLRMNDSGLRELDLKSSSLYLSHQDADLGSSFQQQLEASTLAPELKEKITAGATSNVSSCIHGNALQTGAFLSKAGDVNNK